MMYQFALSICLFIFAVPTIAKNLQNNMTTEDDGCICKTYSCGCCVTLDVPEIGLNDTGCLNFAYLPKEYGISVTLTIDGDAIINETISERNPPPLCMEPPYMEKVIHICIRFYDLDVTSAKFHGCVQLEMRMFYVFSLKEWKLGCFDLDLPSYKDKKYLAKLLKSASKNITESNSVKSNSLPDWKAFKNVLQSKMKDFKSMINV